MNRWLKRRPHKSLQTIFVLKSAPQRNGFRMLAAVKVNTTVLLRRSPRSREVIFQDYQWSHRLASPKPGRCPSTLPSWRARPCMPISHLFPFSAFTQFPLPGSHLFSFLSLTLSHHLSLLVLSLEGAAQIAPNSLWEINSEQCGQAPTVGRIPVCCRCLFVSLSSPEDKHRERRRGQDFIYLLRSGF